jgi:hypothetical protein
MPDTQRLLELALKGLEAERAKIDDEMAQLKRQLNPRSIGATGAKVGSMLMTTQPSAKRPMSAAARKKLSEAMKQSYADRKKTASITTAAQVRKVANPKQNGGSGLTAAGRKKLSDLMKKRWAEKRKAKAK